MSEELIAKAKALKAEFAKALTAKLPYASYSAGEVAVNDETKEKNIGFGVLLNKKEEVKVLSEIFPAGTYEGLPIYHRVTGEANAQKLEPQPAL